MIRDAAVPARRLLPALGLIAVAACVLAFAAGNPVVGGATASAAPAKGKGGGKAKGAGKCKGTGKRGKGNGAGKGRPRATGSGSREGKGKGNGRGKGRGNGRGNGRGKGCRGKGGRGKGGRDRGGSNGGGAGGEQPPPDSQTSGSAEDPPIVAGPGASTAGYATKAPATGVGGRLSFSNLDLVQHDVRSLELAPGGGPLFSSALADPGESVPIAGLDRVSPGTAYEFLCSVHPGMRGTLSIR